MRSLKTPFKKDKRKDLLRPYLSEDSCPDSSQSSEPPSLTQRQGISSLLKLNRFQSLMIKLTYRRINWVFQNIKLINFDMSSILDLRQPSPQHSRTQIMNMTAHNLVLVIDKVLLIKIQNKLSDAFLRIKLIKKRKVKKNVRTQQKVGLYILHKIVQKREMNALSRLTAVFSKPSRFKSMQNLEQSIFKYKNQISRLENVGYKAADTNSSPIQRYVPKECFGGPRRSSGTLVSEFHNCLVDVSNYNFRKDKHLNY